MRVLRHAFALLALASAFGVATAHADGPTITPVSRIVTTPIPFGASCGSFQILFTADAEGTNISFYDDQNQLARQIRTVSFTGTLYNSSDLAKTVPYDGHFTRTFDAATNTITVVGIHFQVRLPGQGAVAIDAGRNVIDTLTGDTTETGLDLDQFVAAVCPALN